MPFDPEKFIVIIHGNIRTNPSTIENAWKDYNIMWSTWKDQNISTNNLVLYNEYPETRGIQNLRYQKISLYNGLLKAKELGYERAIKWRTDQYPTNSNKLMELFDANFVNTLFLHRVDSHKSYFVDYFMEGKIEDLLSIWNFDSYEYEYSEYITTQNILKNQIKINCIGKSLTEENDIVWLNRNPDIRLSSYKNYPIFQTVNIQ